LASRGIRAIPGQMRTEELRGRQWIIKPVATPSMANPQEARIRPRTHGSLSIRFSGYSAAGPQENIIIDEHDEEMLEQEAALMIYCDYDELQEERKLEQDDEDDELEALQLLASLPREKQSHDEQEPEPPKWDDYGDETSGEWINPFSRKGGGEQIETSLEIRFSE
jgi:hypothetical protein